MTHWLIRNPFWLTAQQKGAYDHVITNDVKEVAYEQLKGLLIAVRQYFGFFTWLFDHNIHIIMFHIKGKVRYGQTLDSGISSGKIQGWFVKNERKYICCFSLDVQSGNRCLLHPIFRLTLFSDIRCCYVSSFFFTCCL